MRQVLDTELERFFPLAIDTVYGGYFSDIDYKWELSGRQNKMIVTQARHVWSASNAAMFYGTGHAAGRPGLTADSLKAVAAHGVAFLRKTMWDQEQGGFYDLVTRQGSPITEGGAIVKKAYGNAFAIYGLAAYVRATGDKQALQFAQEAFRWLDRASWDPVSGGYFQFLTREGKPFPEGYGPIPPKDQNSTIHLLESFTALYEVWPDTLLQRRLTSLLHIIRDTIVSDSGYMRLFFRKDWTPVSYRDSSEEQRRSHFELDHISFGHDVETAYLMLEASHALGIKNDARTLAVAKKMVDFSLRNGWEKPAGGIYDGGYLFKGDQRVTIVRETKEWWEQVEAFNAFLLMAGLYPNDPAGYYDKFCVQWDYCKRYVVDQEHGGFYRTGADKEPRIKFAPKGDIWKGAYHTSRALVNCIRTLTGSAG
jgi:mannobiose 2-epimerase